MHSSKKILLTTDTMSACRFLRCEWLVRLWPRGLCPEEQHPAGVEAALHPGGADPGDRLHHADPRDRPQVGFLFNAFV